MNARWPHDPTAVRDPITAGAPPHEPGPPQHVLPQHVPAGHVPAGHAPRGHAPRGLYLITPEEADSARLLARVQPLLAEGISWLQYRNKQANAQLRLQQAQALQSACAAAGVPLIINDDAALAASVGAAGVHLGEDDGDIAAARALLGETAIVGASCYDQLALAERAVAAGASYVAFGAFFPTRSKLTRRRASPQLLQQAGALAVTRVAIGGISPDNTPSLISAGVDLVAVIGGVFDAPDPVLAARAYLACFQRTAHPQG